MSCGRHERHVWARQIYHDGRRRIHCAGIDEWVKIGQREFAHNPLACTLYEMCHSYLHPIAPPPQTNPSGPLPSAAEIFAATEPTSQSDHINQRHWTIQPCTSAPTLQRLFSTGNSTADTHHARAPSQGSRVAQVLRICEAV